VLVDEIQKAPRTPQRLFCLDILEQSSKDVDAFLHDELNDMEYRTG